MLAGFKGSGPEMAWFPEHPRRSKGNTGISHWIGSWCFIHWFPDCLICSEKGEQVFSADQAKHMVSQAQAAKENGAKYCICPACTAGGAILDKKEEILK